MTDFTVLSLKDAYRTSVAATLDILEAAQYVAPQLKLPTPTWRVFEYPDFPKRASYQDNSIWIVPGLGISASINIESRLADDDAVAATRLLSQHAHHGGSIAASCTAVFLLAAADLLSKKTVTTSWLLAPTLAKQAPDCFVDADKMICQDGQFVTAGAAFAHIDLMLYLISHRLGATLADAVSRVLLLNQRDAQAAYIAPQMLATGNSLVEQLTRLIEDSLPEVPKVKDLAEALHMSERTLGRQVMAASGKSPLALIQHVRVQRARALLETSRLPIEHIAEQVGYQDASALRRLMHKVTGAPPSQFRKSTRKFQEDSRR